MSEISPEQPDFDIDNLSPEGKWLKMVEWCGDLLTKANELDKTVRNVQRHDDQKSVIVVFKRYSLYRRLPVRYFRLAPRLVGDDRFGISEILVVLPLQTNILDEKDDRRLVFFHVTFNQRDEADYMISENSIKSLEQIPEKDTALLIAKEVARMNQVPEIDTAITTEKLTFLQSLHDVVCEPAYGFGIGSLPSLKKTDE